MSGSGEARKTLKLAFGPSTGWPALLFLKDQAKHKIEAIYHILLQSQDGIWTISPVEGHSVRLLPWCAELADCRPSPVRPPTNPEVRDGHQKSVTGVVRSKGCRVLRS